MKAKIIYEYEIEMYQGCILRNEQWEPVTKGRNTIIGARISLLLWKWFGSEFDI